jgi:hypothetical protein
MIGFAIDQILSWVSGLREVSGVSVQVSGKMQVLAFSAQV